MSMLAEPRRKKRSMNLRGKNHWSEDQNKFGQKLMEKMGWEPGKGLGMNLDGKVDHVKVRFKDDNGGVGFTDRNDQWTVHDDGFNELLLGLHGGSVDKTKLHSETSLEEKSKKLNSRLHYKKFTRGKDITRYSQKDLANIFGKKTIEEVQAPRKKETKSSEEEVQEETTDSNYNLVAGGSMSDYFKSKSNGNTEIALAGLEKYVNPDIVDSESDNDCEIVFQGFSGTKNDKPKCDKDDVTSAQKKPFSFYGNKSTVSRFVTPCLKKEEVNSDETENVECDISMKDESKNKIVKDKSESSSIDITDSDSNNGRKKKSKKPKFNESSHLLSVANDSVSTECTDVKKKNKKNREDVTIDLCVNENDELKSKKRKRKDKVAITQDEGLPEDTVDLCSNVDESSFSNNKINLKKKKKNKGCSDNDAMDEIGKKALNANKGNNLSLQLQMLNNASLVDLCYKGVVEIASDSEIVDKFGKKKKNKKKCKKVCGSLNEDCQSNIENIEMVEASDDVILCDDLSNCVIEKDAGKKSKKNNKKDKKDKNIVEDESNDVSGLKNKEKKKAQGNVDMVLEDAVIVDLENNSKSKKRKAERNSDTNIKDNDAVMESLKKKKKSQKKNNGL